MNTLFFFFFFSSRRRHTRSLCDWSSDVCSSDLEHDGVRHSGDVNHLPREDARDQVGHAGTLELHRDLGAGHADQIIGDLLGLPAARGLRVDLDDAIALAHSRGLGRRVREDAADRDGALLLLDLHADAGVLAVRLLREARELLGGEELAVWIVELLYQAAGGLFVEGTRADGVDEALRHELEYLIEHARPVGGRPVLKQEAARDDRKERGSDESGATTRHERPA